MMMRATGAFSEFISSARLDNLMMSYLSLNALVDSLDTLEDDTHVRLVSLCTNHLEFR